MAAVLGPQVVRISSHEDERRPAIIHHRRLPIIENVTSRPPMLKSSGRYYGDGAIVGHDHTPYDSPHNNLSLDFYPSYGNVPSPSPTSSLEIPLYRNPPYREHRGRSPFLCHSRAFASNDSDYRESPAVYYSSGSGPELNIRRKCDKPQSWSCHVLVSDSDNESDNKWAMA